MQYYITALSHNNI